MTPKQRRRLQKRLAEQMRLEKLGAPIPGDIRSRMTKPKESDVLYQVHVDVKGEREPLRVGPKMGREAASMILEAVNGQISIGKLPTWGNARLELCLIP